jgi:hypothetical protein
MASGRGPAGGALERSLPRNLENGGASARTQRPLARLGGLCQLYRQSALAPQPVQTQKVGMVVRQEVHRAAVFRLALHRVAGVRGQCVGQRGSGVRCGGF